MPLRISGFRKLLYLLLVLLPASLLPVSTGAGQISESGFGAFEADIEVLDANTVAIAWYDTRHPKAEIYLRLVDKQLRPMSAEFRLSANDVDSYEVDIVALGENIAATWYEIDSAQNSVIKLGLWDRQGQPLWTRTLTNASVKARIPVIAASNGALFIAWLETPADDTPLSNTVTIVGLWIDSSGLNRSDFFVIAPASSTTWNLNIEIARIESSNRIFLAYDSRHETLANELYLAQISDGDISINRLSDDDGYASKYPDIDFRQGKLALTWYDNRFGNNEIYSAVRSVNELASPNVLESLESSAHRISNSDGDSIGAYLCWNGDSLGLTWSDSGQNQKNKEQHDVYFQHLDAQGNPKSEIQQLTQSKADSLIPSIHNFGSGFVLAWNEVTVNAHDAGARQSRSEIAVTLIK
ncbi:MAG: hypothetical protein COC20_01805 [Cellvibrionales bacterium]|nr:MAG: hypothetical protein COC20_01805 [Cellvibrionales bacterium]